MSPVSNFDLVLSVWETGDDSEGGSAGRGNDGGATVRVNDDRFIVPTVGVTELVRVGVVNCVEEGNEHRRFVLGV